jgi:monoterpene epsilon-lactone hydrolase
MNSPCRLLQSIVIDVILSIVAVSRICSAATPALPYTDSQGVVHAAAFSLPPSQLLSKQTISILDRERQSADSLESCPKKEGATADRADISRQCEISAWRASAERRALFQQFAVKGEPQEIGGVQTDVFVPSAGIREGNRRRVLINVHGGGFLGGARISSEVESVPIASVGGIKVVSIDYRMAPRFEFPAASEDVAAVYRELLKTYKPENIGIFGCSAGGLLTAQAVAWFAKEGLPRPGAVALMCEGGFFWGDGDSGMLDRAISGGIPEHSSRDNAYLKDADPNDPLAFPARSKAVLAKFPPTLLISATRDLALSSVVSTHALLVAQGVDAELHVWEGLGHAFQYQTELPESREVYATVASFFDRHLH